MLLINFTDQIRLSEFTKAGYREEKVTYHPCTTLRFYLSLDQCQIAYPVVVHSTDRTLAFVFIGIYFDKLYTPADVYNLSLYATCSEISNTQLKFCLLFVLNLQGV